MTFDRPLGLWILALALPVLLLHFYKGRVRRLAVPLLAFWDQVLIEEDRRSALRRIRHWAGLLLSLLVLTLLAAAFSGPRLRGWSREPVRWAVLIDTAPRMAAVVSPGRSRGEEALRLARDFIRGRGQGDSVSCPEPRLDWTMDLEEAARRLELPWRIGSADLESRVREALASGPDVRVVVFGVRAAPAERVTLVTVGGEIENAGWVGGLLQRKPGEARVTLSLKAAIFSAARQLRQEVLLFNGKELARRPLDLEPGAPIERAWVLDPSKFPAAKLGEGGLAEVLLEPADAFPVDDVAAFVVPPLAPPPVLVFHPGKPSELLMHALETMRRGGMLGSEIAPLPVAEWKNWKTKVGEHAVLIFDRVSPDPAPDRGLVLRLGAPGTGVDKPQITEWDRDSEPFAGLDLSGVMLRRSRLLAGPGGILRAKEGVLATWESRGGFAALELGFALEESDFAARPVFLLMLMNLREAWMDGLLHSYPSQTALGQAVTASRPLWIRDGELRAIQGERAERLSVRAGFPEAPIRLGPGFTRLSAEGRSEWVAANLFDASQSDLRSGAAASPPPPPEPWTSRIPRGAPAALAALLLLVLELALWHRGWI